MMLPNGASDPMNEFRVLGFGFIGIGGLHRVRVYERRATFLGWS